MKKFLTMIIAAIMLVVGCAAVTACGQVRDLDAIVESGEITVATNAEFAPFESREGENYVGIDMDIARYIATELGLTLKINNMDFDSVVTSVQKGQSDLALAGLTINATRLQSINFSEDYFGAAQYLIVKKTDTTFDGCDTKEKVEAKIATLSGNGAAQTGTTGYYYIAGSSAFEFDGFANITAKSYDNAVSASETVKNGQSLFAVVDDEVARQIVLNNPDDFKIIDVALSSEQYGIGVNKGATKLLAKVNEILQEMKDSGELARIIALHTAA